MASILALIVFGLFAFYLVLVLPILLLIESVKKQDLSDGGKVAWIVAQILFFPVTSWIYGIVHSRSFMRRILSVLMILVILVPVVIYFARPHSDTEFDALSVWPEKQMTAPAISPEQP